MTPGTLDGGTQKRYYEDAYATAFEASVLACENRDGLWHVVLDQTLFFPEEGGQSPDKGTLNGITVVDVQIKDAVITHVTEAPLAVGTRVAGEIDWHHRFSNMQQHSGEHLFSGIAHNRFGVDNVGFHLSDREVTLDFDNYLTPEQVAETERAVNEAITADIESVVIYPSKEEEAAYDYRSKIAIDGQVRLISYPGYDLCACCAPHVRRTGEIGLLKVMSCQKYKGGVRISILCGERAMAALCAEHDELIRTARFLSARPMEVYDLVNGLKDEIAALKRQIATLEEEKMQEVLSRIPAEAENVVLFFAGGDSKAARQAVNALTAAHGGYSALFIGNDAEGYHFIIGSAKKSAQTVLNRLKESLTVRGGGRPEMVEGTVFGSEAAIRASLQV